MKTVLFCKTVDLNEVCMDYTCNSLKDLITTSEDGFNLVLSIDSQKLFRFGMYHYDSEDGYCEQSLNKFWSLLEELGISKGSYQPAVRTNIAELAEELLPFADSPYEDDFCIVDSSIYVHQERVADIVEVEEFSKESIKISAEFISNSVCILQEEL